MWEGGIASSPIPIDATAAVDQSQEPSLSGYLSLRRNSTPRVEKQLVEKTTENAVGALVVDRMTAQCPRMRSGQARQPCTARWGAAPACLDPSAAVEHCRNHSLSNRSGDTTGIVFRNHSGEGCDWRRVNLRTSFSDPG